LKFFSPPVTSLVTLRKKALPQKFQFAKTKTFLTIDLYIMTDHVDKSTNGTLKKTV